MEGGFSMGESSNSSFGGESTSATKKMRKKMMEENKQANKVVEKKTFSNSGSGTDMDSEPEKKAAPVMASFACGTDEDDEDDPFGKVEDYTGGNATGSTMIDTKGTV